MEPSYLIIIYRTVLFYIILIIVFKLMGKREIGQLSLLDLIISVMIAEVAALAIDNLERPIMEVVIGMALLGLMQYSTAFITMRHKKIRNFIEGKPSVIISKGIVNIDEMRNQRYTFDDLALQLRSNNISSLFDVEYAILESNGKLSSFKYGESKFYPLAIITSGGLNYHTLKLIDKTEEWVNQQLTEQGIQDVREVYYASYDGMGLKCITRKLIDIEHLRYEMDLEEQFAMIKAAAINDEAESSSPQIKK